MNWKVNFFLSGLPNKLSSPGLVPWRRYPLLPTVWLKIRYQEIFTTPSSPSPTLKGRSPRLRKNFSSPFLSTLKKIIPLPHGFVFRSSPFSFEKSTDDFSPFCSFFSFEPPPPAPSNFHQCRERSVRSFYVRFYISYS